MLYVEQKPFVMDSNLYLWYNRIKREYSFGDQLVFELLNDQYEKLKLSYYIHWKPHKYLCGRKLPIVLIWLELKSF